MFSSRRRMFLVVLGTGWTRTNKTKKLLLFYRFSSFIMVVLLEVKNKLLKTNKYKTKTELDLQVIMRVRLDWLCIGRWWSEVVWCSWVFFHRETERGVFGGNFSIPSSFTEKKNVFNFWPLNSPRTNRLILATSDIFDTKKYKIPSFYRSALAVII